MGRAEEVRGVNVTVLVELGHPSPAFREGWNCFLSVIERNKVLRAGKPHWQADEAR